jgi:hypothetical protein
MRDAVRLGIDNFFHDIINYIWFNSANTYNLAEMRIECCGIHQGSDAANILNYKSQLAYESAPGPGQCLALTFHRIRIRPSAYAIKSGPVNRTTRHLTSHVFQGWGERGEWETIDERQNLLDLLPGYTASLAHLDTAKYFHKFRLMQTDPAPPPGTHFAISAFEIHGEIIALESRQAKAASEAEFNPWAFADME